MSGAAEQLKPELARLAEGDRAALARFLLDSLGGPAAGVEVPSDIEPWVQCLDRRAAELSSGAVTGIPAGVALDRLRERSP